MKKLTGVVVPPVGRGRKRPEVVGEIAREQPPENMAAVDCPEKQAVAEKTHPLDLDLDNQYAFTDMVGWKLRVPSSVRSLDWLFD